MNSIIHCACISRKEDSSPPQYIATPLRLCGLSQKSNNFISRWLDVTKSTLLFAKGVILVEGIAESMLLPIFARQILSEYNQSHTKNKMPETLENAGVSVINMNGIYFKHFMSLFCNLGEEAFKSLPLRCAGITDQDPPKRIPHRDNAKKSRPFKPTPSDIDPKKSNKGISKYKFPPGCLNDPDSFNKPDHYHGENSALELITKINVSDYARLYSGQLKTFEYDLAMEGDNLNVMLQLLLELWPAEGDVKEELNDLAILNWTASSDEKDKAEAAYEVLRRIEDGNIGKGLFAQVLAAKLMVEKAKAFAIPEYIKEAVIWACGGEPDDKA